MSINRQTTVLIVPGLRDHVPEHWQTLLEAQLLAAGVKVHAVPPLEADKLRCAARVEAIEQSLRTIAEPVIVVAHSGGAIMLAHWAQKYGHAGIKGALLATPADLETPLPAGYPNLDVLRAGGWLPIPRARLPFRSIVAASTNDPLAPFAAVESLAKDWGAELVNVGAVGHLNPASGFGLWPQATEFINKLDQGLPKCRLSNAH